MFSGIALITGITGQAGAYLAQLLLSKGYKVYGAIRRNSALKSRKLTDLAIEGEIELVPFELSEFSNILRVIADLKPDELYNLAAQSFVSVSFEHPIHTAEVDALGVARIFEGHSHGQPGNAFLSSVELRDVR